MNLTGRGPMVIVDNVETCLYRVPGEPERRWQPNYTIPIPANSSLTVTGFVGAFTHFAQVSLANAPCQSDLSSAILTTELAERTLSALSTALRQ